MKSEVMSREEFVKKYKKYNKESILERLHECICEYQTLHLINASLSSQIELFRKKIRDADDGAGW